MTARTKRPSRHIRRVRVSVPATCANLGPGFDCLGLAVNLANTFEVIDLSVTRRVRTPGSSAECWPPTPKAPFPQEESVGRKVFIDLAGDRTDLIHLMPEQAGKAGQDSLFLQAFRALYAHLGLAVPPHQAHIEVCLPPGRGLGSSATAVVGGLIAANALLGEPLSRAELLELAILCEPGQHADNVAAALFGGLVLTGARDAAGHMIALPLPVPADLRVVLFIPDQPMSTVRGRSLLPAAYSRQDVTFNLSRVALLLSALQTRQYAMLATAMEDRMHQPYREQLFPALGALIAAGKSAGAHGVCLSGGGSSVLALVTEHAQAVASALQAAAQSQGVSGQSRILAIAHAGAQVTPLPASKASTTDTRIEEAVR